MSQQHARDAVPVASRGVPADRDPGAANTGIRVAVDDGHLNGRAAREGDVGAGYGHRLPCHGPLRADRRDRPALRPAGGEKRHRDEERSCAISRFFGHRLRLHGLERPVRIPEDHLGEEARHHHAFPKVAEPRLGAVAVCEGQRELGIA